jgi:hypothetical protein
LSNLTEDELNQLCREWQERLGLLHWRVNLFIKRSHDLKVRHGECHYTLSRQQASIWLLDPNDHSCYCQFPYDMEEVLVHEILHLHFAPFAAEDDTPEDTRQEQVIETLAVALVKLKRDALKAA